MELLRIDPEHPDGAALNAIAEAVLRGGVVAFPTDTLYGLGCSLFDVSAVELLARLKRRDPSLAVISLIPEPGQVYGLASEVNETAERLMRQFWPGPLSLIFKASSIVPVRVRGAGDTLCQRILERIGGPVVSSSANLSGQPPAGTAEDVVRVFGSQLDLVVDGGPRLGEVPSTLVDVSALTPRLLRRGVLDVTSALGAFTDAT